MSCCCRWLLRRPNPAPGRRRTVTQDWKEASQAQASDSPSSSFFLFGYPGTQQLIQPPSLHATLFDPYFNGKRCATRHVSDTDRRNRQDRIFPLTLFSFLCWLLLFLDAAKLCVKREKENRINLYLNNGQTPAAFDDDDDDLPNTQTQMSEKSRGTSGEEKKRKGN